MDLGAQVPKYRILQVDDVFYPQKKYFGIYYGYMYEESGMTAWFNSYESAKAFIKRAAYVPKVTIHPYP